MCKILLIALLIINLARLYNSLTAGSITLELLDTKFRLSIKHDRGIEWVAFHVNINKEFRPLEDGEFNGVVNEPNNQRLSYEFNRKLEDSDIVHVWLAVQRNSRVYHDVRFPISVAALKNGHVNYGIQIRNASTTTSTEATIEPALKNGNVNNGIQIRNASTTTSTEATIEPTQRTTNLNNGNKVCNPTITEVQSGGGNLCSGDLIFEDEFDTFNQQYWTNEVRIPPSDGDAEFVLYNGTLASDNGILKIDAILNTNINIRRDKIDLGERCTSNVIRSECVHQAAPNAYLPPISTARINTKNNFNFKYGRVEVKAKLPIGDWLFPLIALEPSRKEYGSIYKSGEIRIAYTRGNSLDLNWQNSNINGKRLFGGVVLSKNVTLRHKFMSNVSLLEINESEEHFGERFHIYSLTWKPDELIMAVDGKVYGTIKSDFKNNMNEAIWNRGGDNAPLDQMFYITLGLSAGGHGDFPDDPKNEKPWQNSDPKSILKFDKKKNIWKLSWSQPSLEVDYIKVFAI